MLEDGHDVRWFSDNDAVDKQLALRSGVFLDTVDDVVAFAPDATFLPGNVVPSFIPGLKVQVFHGFEWKKKGHFRIRDCFDLYCTQGPFFTERFLQLREKHPHYSVVETGWPKLDPLFSGSQSGSPNNPPQILYAPTFSPSFTSASALLDEISALSQRQPWQWKVKFHPKMDKQVVQQFRDAANDNLEVVESASILPLLQQCDVMLSDTSSAITEFLLMDKPVVTFNNASPDPVLIDITLPEQLEDALTRALNRDETLSATIRDYCAQMHPYRDGQSARRVLNATLEEIKHFPRPQNKPKPANWLRNIKMRKRLGYWKW